jgi:hypothetical protein
MTAALVNEAFILSMPDGPRAELQRIIDSLPPVTLKQWIASGALREWLQQSTTVTTARGGKSEEKLSQLIAAIPTILPQVEGNEIGDWVRAALDIAESYPAVFASLPPQLSRLELSERLNVYRLVRSAAYRSPEAAYYSVAYNLPRPSIPARCRTRFPSSDRRCGRFRKRVTTRYLNAWRG